MKILAIRGKNLASIAGEFEIDFTREPLVSAGIFAICGSTGSGKSTLLDALCLALFNNIPRTTGIEGAKVPDVGKELIQQSDRRQILRRGTAEGYAEVDFTGVDGKAYRSLWRVRRANNRVNGKLQPVEIRVYNLATNIELAYGIQESTALLARLTGLTYEQFTRTVLLAQNEFARFLKARKDEKAEVLEKLTGTEIYSVISNTVYNRSMAARTEWKQLHERLGNIRLMSPDELAALHKQAEELTVTIQKVQQQQEGIAHKIQWYQELTQIEQNRQKAALLLQEAQQSMTAFAPQAAWLKQIESVEGARSIYRDKSSSIIRLQKQKENLQTQQTALGETETTYQKTLSLYTQQKTQADTLQATYNALKPELLKARELDLEQKNITSRLKECEEALQELNQTLAEQESYRAEQEHRLQQLTQQIITHETWFDKNRQHEQTCLNIDTITGFLDTADTARSLLKTQKQKLEQLYALQTEKAKRQISFTTEQQQNEKAIENLQQKRRQLQEKATGYTLPELRQKRNLLTEQKELLQKALTICTSLEQAQQEYKRHQEETQAKQELLKAVSSQLTAKNEACQKVETEKDKARQTYEKARLSLLAEVTNLRNQLAPEQPCPVCGSVHHPYTESQAPSSDSSSQLSVLYEEKEIHYRELYTETIRLAQQQMHLSEITIALEKEQTGLAKTCEEWRLKWRHVYSEIQKRLSKTYNHTEDIEHEIHNIEALLIRQTEKEKIAEEIDQELKRVEQELAECTQKANLINHNLQSINTENNTISIEISREKGKEENLLQQIEEALEKVSNRLSVPNWQQRWEEDYESFRETLCQAARKWKTKQQECDQCQQEKQQLLTVLTENLKTVENLRQNKVTHTALLQERQQMLQQNTVSRTKLLQGKPVEETELFYEQLLNTYRKELETTTHIRDTQAATLQQLKGELSQLKIAIEGLEKEMQQHTKELANWLTQYNASASTTLTENDLTTLFEVPSGQIQAVRQQQTVLRDQLTAAQATFEERSLQLEAHRNHPQRPDFMTESLENLLRQQEQGQLQEKTFLRQQTEISLELRNQEQNQQLAAGIRQELEEKTSRMEQWAKLDDLIGSQSGYKFKEIAQGYTLDILLAYANQQLQELTPRYRLQRVPDELALQVIDHDMCDEVRSVFSLSGGESFLVSLALALGLSSFASKNHQEENLFIDEGFGTLDAETLQTVLEALERLRSQGRKVGIISHVAEMAERIPTRICLAPAGNGKSKVKVVG